MRTKLVGQVVGYIHLVGLYFLNEVCNYFYVSINNRILFNSSGS